MRVSLRCMSMPPLSLSPWHCQQPHPIRAGLAICASATQTRLNIANTEEKKMEVRLDGRSAIVTGASKGLGLAMAKEFAASGADVAMLARRPEVLEEAKQTVASAAQGGRVATFVC